MNVGVNSAVPDISDLKVGVGGAVRAVSEAYIGVSGAVKKVWPSIPVGTQFILDTVGSGTWTCPVSGSWQIEMHGGGGGGGGGHRVYNGSGGGGSGEVVTAYLTIDSAISFEIGSGGAGGTAYEQDMFGHGIPASDGEGGGTTIFGTYSIEGGGKGLAGSYTCPGGASAGSLAGAGGSGGMIIGYGGKGNTQNPSQIYGYGGVGGTKEKAGIKGKDGAIILTYLG